MLKLMMITWFHRALSKVLRAKSFVIEIIEEIMKSLGLVQGDNVTRADYWKALDKVVKKCVKCLVLCASAIVSLISIMVHVCWKFK